MCFSIMAAHQRDFPSTEDVIIPWNRRYTFPTVANKATKTTPRIQPISGGSFSPGTTIQINLPAQGYMNPINSYLSFDVDLIGVGATPAGAAGLRFQNNIQSLFERVEIKYGATHLEDINNYNLIVRPMSEWTATNNYDFDQTSIAEGLGGVTTAPFYPSTTGAAPTTPFAVGLSSIRQRYIQGIDGTGTGQTGTITNPTGGFGIRNTRRRYCVQLMTGLMQQRKLIPLKWMASQFSLLITLAQPNKCIVANSDTATGATYSITNVNFIPELLEFDSSFDAYLLAGLKNGGMPIKYSTWRNYSSPVTQASVNVQILESAKSLKSIFSFLKRTIPVLKWDYGASPFFPGALNTLQSYQYRIGGRYYPSAPVQCGVGAVPNGGGEAYMELAKALYTVGDYKLSSGTNAVSWGHPIAAAAEATGPPVSYTFSYSGEAESDFEVADYYFQAGTFGTVDSSQVYNYMGNIASQCFAMAISLETANSVDYSGLNAEEQSNIIFSATYSAAPGSVAAGCASQIDYSMMTFTFIDKMIVLGENNKLTVLE